MAISLTSSNLKLQLAVTNLYPVPQQITGFAEDDAVSSESVTITETRLGVDGLFLGGRLPHKIKVKIKLMAGSPSRAFFEQWAASQDSSGGVYVATGYLAHPSLGTAYTLTNGYLTVFKPFADAKKLMEDVEYETEWGSVIPSNIPTA